MSSWGGDNFFVIRVYQGTTYKGRMEFSKSSAGSPYIVSFSGLKKGTKYGYEIWKNENGKYIKGTGSLSY